jgi:hypothetical protein
MAISYPIFPIQLPNQSFNSVARPIRGGPGWNVKQSPVFSNKIQQSVSGQKLAVKYWTNPLWKWEFLYEVLFNDPSKPNLYYPAPVPETDFEMLSGFFCGMQGTAGVFAYQPPDSVRGGTFTATSVLVSTANVAIIKTNGGTAVTQLRLGDVLHASGFGTSTYLNGENGTVVGISPTTNTITLSIATGGTHAFTSDSGTLIGGQPLLAADANTNSELVATIGGYPTTLSTSPASTLVTESVQLIDGSPTVYANGSSVSYAVNDPETVAPYQGYVFHFTGGVPTTPITCAFTRYYLCRFSEDTQEYENFMAMLWSCSSVKIEQERI